jgi:hypothetical protein
MTPEVKLAPVWVDRKNDYSRHKEKQKIRRYSDEYGIRRIFVFLFAYAIHQKQASPCFFQTKKVRSRMCHSFLRAWRFSSITIRNAAKFIE